MIKSKKDLRRKARYAIRNKISGTSEQPRLAVFRSNKQIYAQLINDIEESISLKEWNYLVDLWKKKISILAKPQNISDYELDNLLETYYLNTEIPTLDYVYSLCALGASSPKELQSILESTTKEQFLEKCQDLLNSTNDLS